MYREIWLVVGLSVFITGCTKSGVGHYFNIEKSKEIGSVTVFVTKWNSEFSVDEAGCPKGWQPMLIKTSRKRNGSKTFIVRCKSIAI